MAQDIAREIITQSRSMQVHQSPLAFKFDNEAGKSLLLSTSVENGVTAYHITIEEGNEKGSFVYQDFGATCDCVKLLTVLKGPPILGVGAINRYETLQSSMTS